MTRRKPRSRGFFDFDDADLDYPRHLRAGDRIMVCDFAGLNQVTIRGWQKGTGIMIVTDGTGKPWSTRSVFAQDIFVPKPLPAHRRRGGFTGGV